MDFKLELVIVPVSDVDRAKAFYTEQAGFDLLVDHRAGDDFRVSVHLPLLLAAAEGIAGCVAKLNCFTAFK